MDKRVFSYGFAVANGAVALDEGHTVDLLETAVAGLAGFQVEHPDGVVIERFADSNVWSVVN